MKRIDRLATTVRHEAMMCLLFFFAALAAGAWAVAAIYSGTTSGGAALGVLAAIALFLAWAHYRECIRVARLAMKQMEWEVEP